VVCLNCELPPAEALKKILEIETSLGRIRDPVSFPHTDRKRTRYLYQPRQIDIDILFYGNRIIRTDELIIPHPLICDRRFILVPLAEVAASFIHPSIRKPVKQLLAECTDTRQVTRWEKVIPQTNEYT
jgi:2-amino-4-hydroxy-6-hydroxymethyldihydropteridine diphosphokinase